MRTRLEGFVILALYARGGNTQNTAGKIWEWSCAGKDSRQSGEDFATLARLGRSLVFTSQSVGLIERTDFSWQLL